MRPIGWKYSLREALLALAGIAMILAIGRINVWWAIPLGAPLSFTAFALAAGTATPRSAARSLVTLPVGLSVLFMAAVFYCIRHTAAEPDTATIQIMLAMALAWLAAACVAANKTRLVMLAVPVLSELVILAHLKAPYAVEYYLPIDGVYLQDVKRDRWRSEFAGLRFTWEGANTALLERMLGHAESQWLHHCFTNPHIRDGNERVNIRSMIHSDHLSQVLALLPDDAARRTVLQGLTDSENLLRVHQGLLLECLSTMGFPPGFDSRSWWQHHAVLFRREPDPKQAIQTFWGWTDRIVQFAPGTNQRFDEIHDQLVAARYQETASGWGSDDAVSQFLFDRNLDIRGPLPPDMPPIGLYQVAWW